MRHAPNAIARRGPARAPAGRGRDRRWAVATVADARRAAPRARPVQAPRSAVHARASPRCASDHPPRIRVKSLAREADRLTCPRLRTLCSPLLGVEQREQPETDDVAFGDVRRIGSLDGLHRDPPCLVELAGEEQGLRQAARTPTLRTSAPARAAATARRACSTAAPTSPRSIATARVTSTTASTYGDHSSGRSRRARSATASSR